MVKRELCNLQLSSWCGVLPCCKSCICCWLAYSRCYSGGTECLMPGPGLWLRLLVSLLRPELCSYGIDVSLLTAGLSVELSMHWLVLWKFNFLIFNNGFVLALGVMSNSMMLFRLLHYVCFFLDGIIGFASNMLSDLAWRTCPCLAWFICLALQLHVCYPFSNFSNISLGWWVPQIVRTFHMIHLFTVCPKQVNYAIWYSPQPVQPRCLLLWLCSLNSALSWVSDGSDDSTSWF